MYFKQKLRAFKWAYLGSFSFSLSIHPIGTVFRACFPILSFFVFMSYHEPIMRGLEFMSWVFSASILQILYRWKREVGLLHEEKYLISSGKRLFWLVGIYFTLLWWCWNKRKNITISSIWYKFIISKERMLNVEEKDRVWHKSQHWTLHSCHVS